jgi:hypothetical protein
LLEPKASLYRSGLTRLLLVPVGLVVAGFGFVACGGAARPAGVAGKAVSYAVCMRTHGVVDYPDPKPISQGSNQGVRIETPDLSSPVARAAAHACEKYRPGGSGVDSPRDQTHLLKFASCMRTNGIQAFPDPTRAGGFPPSVGRLDRETSVFRVALSRCLQIADGAIQLGPGGNPTWPVEP